MSDISLTASRGSEDEEGALMAFERKREGGFVGGGGKGEGRRKLGFLGSSRVVVGF